MSKKKSARLTSYAWLLINVVVWGAAAVIVKPSLSVTTPFRFLLYRFFFAALFTLPFLFFHLRKLKNKLKVLGKITLLEFLGTTVVLTFFYFGLARTTAIETSLIATAAPIFVTIGAVLFLKEKEEKHETMGLLIAFLGTIALTLLPIIKNGGLSHLSLTGNLFIIAHNTAWAAYILTAKKHYHKMSKLFVTSVSFWVGLITFFGLSWFETGSTLPTLIQTIQADFQHTSVWIASLYMAIFGSIIGLTAYIKGQDGIEASEASFFAYLQPLVYIPLAFVLLGEQILPIQITLLGVILFGVFVAEKRTNKRKAHR